MVYFHVPEVAEKKKVKKKNGATKYFFLYFFTRKIRKMMTKFSTLQHHFFFLLFFFQRLLEHESVPLSTLYFVLFCAKFFWSGPHTVQNMSCVPNLLSENLDIIVRSKY